MTDVQIPSGPDTIKHDTAVGSFDIKAAYLKFLHDDPDMTMPVAAIESLVALLKYTQPSTSSELITVLTQAADQLKKSVKNSISLSAGCDLFTRFVVRNISQYPDWESAKTKLVENGKVFVERARRAREEIAEIGLPFIRDDDTILVHGRSRAVLALLQKAASKYVRFKVYVSGAGAGAATETETTLANNQGALMATSLRKAGIPVCTIPDSAVGYVIDKVDKVLLGAEGVVESGGVINRIGSYQIALLAKYSNKPVYVVAESHKFVRLYPLSPSDIATEYPLEFTTDVSAADKNPANYPQVDYTPHEFITALITDLGTLTPSGVSEELIKIWFD